MATLQLSFSIRTSSNCKSVHLVGNWDGYRSQLPLSKDSSKSGSWKGTFRFSGTLQQGQRYWYYYVMDGYSVTHDPAQPSTIEPTTQRKLNILDVPRAKPQLSVRTDTSSSSKRSSRRLSSQVPQGRSLSPSKIVSPRPQKPHEARRLANKRYSGRDMDELTERLSRTQVSSSFSSDDESDSDASEIDSDASSDIPSLSSGSSRASPASSLMSPISPAGSPRMYADQAKFARSGSSDLSSSDSEGEYYRTKLVTRRGNEKRHGIAVRHSRR